MSSLLCWIWPYLMGGLIAWLLAGWLARGGRAARAVESPSAIPPAPPAVTPVQPAPAAAAVLAPPSVAAVLAPPSVAALASPEPALVDRSAALREVEIDVAAARAAGLDLKGPDDLEVIEGIGPKIAELLNAAGIRRFRELAVAVPADLQKILDAAGPHFRLAHPDTWPEQAMLAAHNHWRALRQLQAVLVGGVRK